MPQGTQLAVEAAVRGVPPCFNHPLGAAPPLYGMQTRNTDHTATAIRVSAHHHTCKGWRQIHSAVPKRPRDQERAASNPQLFPLHTRTAVNLGNLVPTLSSPSLLPSITKFIHVTPPLCNRDTSPLVTKYRAPVRAVGQREAPSSGKCSLQD